MSVFSSLVGFAPYALNAVRTREAEDEAAQQRALARMYQANADTRAGNADQRAGQLNQAQLAHIAAQTTKLQEPVVAKPKRTPLMFSVDGQPVQGTVDEDGNYYDATNKRVTGTVTPFKVQAPTRQDHVVDPVTGEVKFFDPTKPPPSLKLNPKPPSQGTFSFPTVGGPNGPVVARANNKTGVIELTDVQGKPPASGGTANLPAPLAAKVGQAGEMMKKAADLLPMMEGLSVSLGQSAAADVAQNGVGIGHARVPGTKGLGNMLVNKTPNYAEYQAALTPFVLAAAHALSGARINNEQVEHIRRSIELAPGDLKNPNVVALKRKNLVDLINSIGGSLPGDAMSAQEGQIDPKQLQALEGYGYKRAKGKAPAAGPSGDIDLRQPAPAAKGKATAKPKADYGIFGPPSGEDGEA